MMREQPPPQADAPFNLSKNGLDPALLGSVGILLVAVAFIIYRLLKLQWDEAAAKRRAEALMAMADDDEGQRGEAQVVGGRRRNVVRRRVNHGADDFASAMLNDNEDEGDGYEGPGPSYEDRIGDDGKKIGKKKAEKLQMKEEKKAMREYEAREREERKKREAEKEKRREEERERERLEEEAEQARLQKEKEEREKKEHEEYLAMKEAFSVEEEGFDENDDEESRNLMEEFVNFVKEEKVVTMDLLASKFNMRTEQVAERLQFFLGNGQLQGVTDDRGKFIYISDDELAAVAKFVNQRGRVSISELANQSNELVRLEPSVVVSE